MTTKLEELSRGIVTEELFDSISKVVKREAQSLHYRKDIRSKTLEELESDFLSYAIDASICYAKKPVKGVEVEAHVCQRLRFDGARIAFNKRAVDKRTVDYSLSLISDKRNDSRDHDIIEALTETLSSWRNSQGRELISKILDSLRENGYYTNVGKIGKALGLSNKESYDTWNTFKQHLEYNLGRSDIK